MSADLKYYTQDSFNRDDKALFYGFFTRQGGVSEGLYEGLNCGFGSNDLKEDVSANRNLVAQRSGVVTDSLLSVYQIHGNKVVTVNDIWSDQDRPQADAMVTDKQGIGLGILTADCTPVLFAGYKKSGEPVVGAAHAGWGGALSGVLGNTVDAMRGLGADKETIRACVGPCIAQPSYEVGANFLKPFIDENDEADRFFHDSLKEGHYQFDLSGYCAWRLARYGLKNVSLLDMDTYANKRDFFSYRRTTHRKEVDYGRQISVISINRSNI